MIIVHPLKEQEAMQEIITVHVAKLLENEEKYTLSTDIFTSLHYILYTSY